MSIVTKTGDGGQTGLFGPTRTSKASARLHAYGTVDELNALLGQSLAERPLVDPLRTQLHRIHNMLFTVGADLACPPKPWRRGATPLSDRTKAKRVTVNHIGTLERWIEELEGQLPPLQSFIVPGGSKGGALLHLARTVCRRAERWVVALKEQEPINPQVLIFLNRLGDYLFLAARAVNRAEGIPEEQVQYE